MKSSVTKFAAIGECMLEFATHDSMQYQLKYAGDTFNASLYLARYADNINVEVDYITALGDDYYSDRMLKSWRAEGINTSLVAQLPGELPGLYLIRNDEDGERYFNFYRQQAAAKQLLHTPLTATMLKQLPSYDYIYLSSIGFAILSPEDRNLLLATLNKCSNSKIIFDPNYRVVLWKNKEEAVAMIEKLLPLVNIGLPTLDNDQEIFTDNNAEECAARWHAAGVEEVVVKQGGRPCLVSTVAGSTYISGAKVIEVVDTTAAGDSFNAGYLAARIKGLEPREAAKKGHQLASTVIQHRGAIMDKVVMPLLFE